MKTTTKFKKIFIVSLLVLVVSICKAQVTTISARLANPCKTLSVKAEVINNSFTIYPNPSNNGIIYIQLNGSLDQYSRITISDMIGRTVFQKNNLQNNTSPNLLLRLDNLTPGVYLIEVKSKKGKETKKLIISK